MEKCPFCRETIPKDLVFYHISRCNFGLPKVRSKNYEATLVSSYKDKESIQEIGQICLQTFEHMNNQYPSYLLQINSDFCFNNMKRKIESDLENRLEENVNKWINEKSDDLKKLPFAPLCRFTEVDKASMIWTLVSDSCNKIDLCMEVERRVESHHEPTTLLSCTIENVTRQLIKQYTKLGYLPPRVIEQLRCEISKDILLKIVSNFYKIRQNFYGFQ